MALSDLQDHQKIAFLRWLRGDTLGVAATRSLRRGLKYAAGLDRERQKFEEQERRDSMEHRQETRATPLA